MEHGNFPALGPHGFHRVAYTQWGNKDAPKTIVCVHGLTRNGRDFDRLADALSKDYRVVCPDMPGRGHSDKLPAGEDYQYPVYLQTCAALIAHLGVDAVDWVGTSMGGLVGMLLAAQPGTPIRRLILNDIGARVPGSALARIAQYAGNTGPFATLEELEQRLRTVHAPFGSLTDKQWQHLAQHSHWRDEDGRFWLAYDPAIAEPLQTSRYDDVDLNPVWTAVSAPVLLLRGEYSDVLPVAVADAMVRSHPNCRLLSVADTGHAPALMSEDQILAIQDWLQETPRG